MVLTTSVATYSVHFIDNLRIFFKYFNFNFFDILLFIIIFFLIKSIFQKKKLIFYKNYHENLADNSTEKMRYFYFHNFQKYRNFYKNINKNVDFSIFNY